MTRDQFAENIKEACHSADVQELLLIAFDEGRKEGYDRGYEAGHEQGFADGDNDFGMYDKCK